MQLGMWRNFDDLEDSLCLAELFLILDKRRELNYEEKRFQAALAGADIGDSGSSFNENNLDIIDTGGTFTDSKNGQAVGLFAVNIE